MEGNFDPNFKLLFVGIIWCSLLASNFLLYRELKALKREDNPPTHSLRLRREADQYETNEKAVDITLTAQQLKRIVQNEMNRTLHKFMDKILDKKINKFVQRNACKESSNDKKDKKSKSAKNVYRTCESKGEINEPGNYTFHVNWEGYKYCRWDIKLNRPIQIKIGSKLNQFSRGCSNPQVGIIEKDPNSQAGICQVVGNETLYDSNSGNVIFTFETDVYNNKRLNVKKISMTVI